ncbi:hypothetical protein BaRGS_00008564 [Batillaria attramentaria]|uniref:GPI alpha-1,4-mannosyltransferase I, catalytic subunit n=1 Tax=Batillaria attramentaria TaxID=370345 RepID=A0ABD0LM68_9CAEN
MDKRTPTFDFQHFYRAVKPNGLKTGGMAAGEGMIKWYSLATALRLALLLYAEWQDQTMVVKYTDVDYYVFSDAAKFVSEGESPYQRATFRYTPLLAWALVPNILLHPFFGKLLFIAFDILTGHLIYTILRRNSCQESTAKVSALLWLLNPLPMTVSSRGNAEPTWNRVKFGMVAGITLVLLTAVFYAKYGWVFLYETYLYHVVRRDIRHNFSPYFYMLYLTASDDVSVVIKFLVFFPQVLLLVAIALRFHGDLPLSCFLCTFTFVMLNKVCTSQYFLWYLCLLPLLVPRLNLTWMRGLWLLPAYLLEFEGQNTFLYIWLAGLIFFLVNVYIVFTIVTHYDYSVKSMLPKQD